MFRISDYIQALAPQKYIDIDDHFPHGPLPMKALELFPGYRPITPIAEPRSDFDYAAALNSDVMDQTLQAIVDELRAPNVQS